MPNNGTTSVVAAFDMLIEEVEAEIDLVNTQGSRAFESRDYDRARDVLEQAAQVTAFREKLDNLRREWATLSITSQGDNEEATAHRQDLGRLQRGLRTPEEEYRMPILSALIELGGSAPLGDVLDMVGSAMNGTLREVDYEPLASNPDLPRWRNAAQWSRNTMARDGLLKANSPRGIWQISDVGRELVTEESNNA